MPNPDHRAKTTIEDLLRLKRAERPDAEFWTGFDRELRQKQLTALLEKRPWWQGVPRFLARRAYLPVGATAVLAFTLASVKYYAPVQVVQVESGPAGSAVAVRPDGILAAPQPAAPVSSPLVNRNDQPVAVLSVRPELVNRNEQSASLDLTPVPSSPADSPSARSIAANLAHLEQSEPELMNSVLGNRLSSPARVPADPGPAVELASLSNGTSRRTRLLAHYNDHQVSIPEPTATDVVRESIARRLADMDYTDRFSRIGLKGDQVSLKF